MPRTTITTDRQRIEVNKNVKRIFKDFKKQSGYKSDSLAAAHLLALYLEQHEKITLQQDKQLRKKAEEMNNQSSL